MVITSSGTERRDIQMKINDRWSCENTMKIDLTRNTKIFYMTFLRKITMRRPKPINLSDRCAVMFFCCRYPFFKGRLRKNHYSSVEDVQLGILTLI